MQILQSCYAFSSRKEQLAASCESPRLREFPKQKLKKALAEMEAKYSKQFGTAVTVVFPPDDIINALTAGTGEKVQASTTTAFTRLLRCLLGAR